MKPFWIKDWVPSNPNRETRRELLKELEKLRPLAKIDAAFASILETEDIDYDLTLGFYKGEYKKACTIIMGRNRFKYWDINENFIQDKYGYDKEKLKKYDNKIQLLEPIRKFINK
jgi:hypothetical protein